MKKLIAMTILSLTMFSAGSFAEGNEIFKEKMIAKAESNNSSGSAYIKHLKVKNQINEDNVTNGADGQETGNRSRDISFLIKEELKADRSINLEYKAPSIKFKELPLFLSSKNEKTKGVVFPPFLYFKKQF